MPPRFNKGGGDAARKQKMDKRRTEKDAAAKGPQVSTRERVYWGDEDDPFNNPMSTSLAASNANMGKHKSASAVSAPTAAARQAAAAAAQKRINDAQAVFMSATSESLVLDVIATAEAGRRAEQSALLQGQSAAKPLFDSDSDDDNDDDNDNDNSSGSRSKPTRSPVPASVPTAAAVAAPPAAIAAAEAWQAQVAGQVSARLTQLGFRAAQIAGALASAAAASPSELLAAHRQFLTERRAAQGALGDAGALHGHVTARTAQCLDWLCLHVKEAALPDKFIGSKQGGLSMINFAAQDPEGGGTGASPVLAATGEAAAFGAGVAGAMKRMALVDELARAGFPRRETAEALEEAGWDLFVALHLLFDWFGLAGSSSTGGSAGHGAHTLGARPRLLPGYAYRSSNSSGDGGDATAAPGKNLRAPSGRGGAAWRDSVSDEDVVLASSFPATVGKNEWGATVLVFGLRELGIKMPEALCKPKQGNPNAGNPRLQQRRPTQSNGGGGGGSNTNSGHKLDLKALQGGPNRALDAYDTYLAAAAADNEDDDPAGVIVEVWGREHHAYLTGTAAGAAVPHALGGASVADIAAATASVEADPESALPAPRAPPAVPAGPLSLQVHYPGTRVLTVVKSRYLSAAAKAELMKALYAETAALAAADAPAVYELSEALRRDAAAAAKKHPLSSNAALGRIEDCLTIGGGESAAITAEKAREQAKKNKASAAAAAAATAAAASAADAEAAAAAADAAAAAAAAKRVSVRDAWDAEAIREVELREQRSAVTRLLALNDTIEAARRGGALDDAAAEIRFREALLRDAGLWVPEPQPPSHGKDKKDKKEKKEKKEKKDKKATGAGKSGPEDTGRNANGGGGGDDDDDDYAAIFRSTVGASSNHDPSQMLSSSLSSSSSSAAAAVAAKLDAEYESALAQHAQDAKRARTANAELLRTFLSLTPASAQALAEFEAAQARAAAAADAAEDAAALAALNGRGSGSAADAAADAALDATGAGGLDSALWDGELPEDLTAQATASLSRVKVLSPEEQAAADAESYTASAAALAARLADPVTVAASAKALQEHRKRQATSKYQKMLAARAPLPSMAMRREIEELVESHRVVVVAGATGCGKSTQVPQFLLDCMLESGRGAVANVVCTQPRRLAATAVAERVADERAVTVGSEVGYQIRLEAKRSAATKLLFCTHGILIRQLEGDPLLSEVSHVVVDEVHERSIDSDFLLILLRDLLKRRADIKIVLMSATINADVFVRYFGGTDVCGVIDVPGRTFPVQRFYLEDAVQDTNYEIADGSPFLRRGGARRRQTDGAPGSGSGGSGGNGGAGMSRMQRMAAGEMREIAEEQRLLDSAAEAQALSESGRVYKPKTMRTIEAMDEDKVNFECIAALVAHVVAQQLQGDDGAVLIFVPGLAEIMDCMKYLQQHRQVGRPGALMMIPLHSALSSEDQHKCFAKAPRGTVKVVVSTNVAETSLTIDDITVVIDAGKMKEMRYDSRSSMSSLVTTWVTQANAKQRAGRAGRVRPGLCYHLFTKSRYETEFPPQQPPEMLRAPLEALCLHVKILGHANVEEFLSKALEPPSRSALRHTLLALKNIRAIEQQDGQETLTPLGYHLASLPVDVRVGKMMLYGAIFRCLDPVLTIAAGMSLRSPFYAPIDNRDAADEAKRRFTHQASDHMTVFHAYQGWLRARARGEEGIFKTKYFLSINTLQTMRDMKRQFAELLSSIKFVPAGVSARTAARLAARGGPGCDGVREATGDALNSNSDNLSLVQAVVVAGLYPNLVQIKGLGALKTDPKLARLLAPKHRPAALVTPTATAGAGAAGATPVASASASAVEGATTAAAAPAKASAEEVNAALSAPVTAGSEKIFEVNTATSVLKFVAQKDGELAPHPTSVIYGQLNLPGPYFVYQQKVKTSKTYIRDLSPCSPYALMLFGGAADVNHLAGLVTIDGWIDLRTRPRVAVLFKNMRALLHRLLRQKIETPELDLAAVSSQAVSVTAALFEAETAEGAARVRARQELEAKHRAADAKAKEERLRAAAERVREDARNKSAAAAAATAAAASKADAAAAHARNATAANLLLSVPSAASEIVFGGLEEGEEAAGAVIVVAAAATTTAADAEAGADVAFEAGENAPMFAAEDGVYGMYEDDLEVVELAPHAAAAAGKAQAQARGGRAPLNNNNKGGLQQQHPAQQQQQRQGASALRQQQQQQQQQGTRSVPAMGAAAKPPSEAAAKSPEAPSQQQQQCKPPAKSTDAALAAGVQNDARAQAPAKGPKKPAKPAAPMSFDDFLT